MAQFRSYDGTRLAFRRAGTGRPLVCLPGGPGRTPDYLGDLGGLGGSRELILPDTRGTGESAVPADPAATYRCDQLARDVEALRAELGLERIDLLGHSAGGSVALRYAAAYPGGSITWSCSARGRSRSGWTSPMRSSRRRCGGGPRNPGTGRPGRR